MAYLKNKKKQTIKFNKMNKIKEEQLKTIQEQQTIIDNLKTRIEVLET